MAIKRVGVSRLAAVVLVLIMSLSMARVAGDGQETAQEASIEASVEDYVRVGWTSEVYSWNPLTITLAEDYVACYLIHSSLFTYNQDWTGPVGDLALDWSMEPQPDGTMYTYVSISNNAYFRNSANPSDTSRPLTASDVEFTLDLIKANPGNSFDWYLRDVYEVEVLGDFELVIKTVGVTATLIDDLAGIPILPEYVYGSIARPLAAIAPSALVGSGPFVFNSMSTGAWYSFAKAPNYHGEADYGVNRTVTVPGIIYNIFTDNIALALAMNGGDLDTISLGGDTSVFLDVLGSGASVNVHKQAVSEPGICDVAINAIPMAFRTATYGEGNPHLLDPVVRQALLMTLDKDFVVNVILEGLPTMADSVLQPGYWHADIDQLPFDPDAAKALLMQNGYSNDLDGDGYLEASADAYVVLQGLAPVGSELSGIRCQAPDSDPNYYAVASAWAGNAVEAGIGLVPSMHSEAIMINYAWYKADYDIWVWHWLWGPEPLGSALSTWLTSELVPGGYNCQAPMGPWWVHGSVNGYEENYSTCPYVDESMIEEFGMDEEGFIGFSAFDQNMSIAQRTLDVAERKAIVDKLQQWIYDSYTESPPYYDLGLYAFTDARFVGWGDWASYPGRTIMSDLLWLWFDLEPAGNQPPAFDMPLQPAYEVVVGETVTFEVIVSDHDGDPLIVNWSFGDGEIDHVVIAGDTTVPTEVSMSHVYSAEATGLVLVVSLDDGLIGHEVSSIATVDVVSHASQRMAGYWWHNMFNEPLGEWYDYRYQYYRDYEVISDTYPYMYRTGNASTCTYYSNMRLNVMTDSLPEVNMNSNPQFLPYLGGERGGTAVIDWYMQYLTMEDMERYPDHTAAWYDGWVVGLTGTTFLDSAAAKSVLGITDGGLADFNSWWAANREQVTISYIDWLLYEGNVRLDIYPMYEYSFIPLSFDLDAYSYDGNVVLSYDVVSWGMEALMTRWLHEAFMPTEWYFEDFSIHAEIFPDVADIDVDTSVVGALFAWKDIDTGIPSWGWRGMLQDYIPSSVNHPASDFDTYADLEFMDMYAGSTWYGKMIDYHYTPGAFNLAEGEEMWFEWPEGPQTFIVDGIYRDYVTAEYGLAEPYSEPSPYDLPSSVSLDPALRTLRFEGPMDVLSWSEQQTTHDYLESEWDRLGVLPYGMPWIEFRADMISPEPEAPVAVIGSLPELALVGEIVTFDATGSYDPDGTILSYSWDFGDGSTAYGETVSHAYAQSGEFEVTLTVMDDDMLTGQDSSTLAVASVPVASMRFLPLVPGVGEVVTFYGYDSYDESGIVDCHWDFGDGMNMSGWVVEHAYIERGEYTVCLTVTNSYGIQASTSAVIEVGQIGSGVRGEVVSEDLRPLRNADVIVTLDGMVVGSAHTNGDGGFLIRGLIPGTYDLIVSRNGYATVEMSISVGEGVLDVGTIVLERNKGASTSVLTATLEQSPAIGLIVLLGMAAAAGIVIRRRAKHPLPT